MSLLRVNQLRTQIQTSGSALPVVDGVCFEVSAAESVGIVGESGCGKSMTALSIVGLLPPAGKIVGGRISFDGCDLSNDSAKQLRKLRGGEIGMVFQEPMTSLNPVYSVGEQIAEAILVREPRGHRNIRQRVIDLLNEVGIPDPSLRVDDYPHQLSGGMIQRVMIAIALSGAPRLLIADEPTTALDVTVQAQILELLANKRKKFGMGLILISHDLGVIAENCQRVLVMYAGQIVESGPADTVFATPRHPYTGGLLRSLPDENAPGSPLFAIPGQVPAPSEWLSGCRFRNRCARRSDRCSETPPEEFGFEGRKDDDSPTSMVRCWHPLDPLDD